MQYLCSIKVIDFITFCIYITNSIVTFQSKFAYWTIKINLKLALGLNAKLSNGIKARKKLRIFENKWLEHSRYNIFKLAYSS